MRTISGKRLPSLRSFSDVLDAWIKANVLCAYEWGDDVPWWYNERASLSVLAGAVWKVGGIAFEEFSTKKRKKQRKKGLGKLYLGREDLYIKIGDHHFIAEAKQIWSGATRRNYDPTDRIQRELETACAQIKKSPPNGQRRLGMLFVVPHISRSNQKMVDDCINNWVNKIKEVDCSCCAWAFPSTSRTIKFGNKLYPGVAVFIREI
jgi:hypothetical protein